MSIKKNYLYNLLRVFNQLLFPMLTIPYISRILGAEGIGTVEYFIAIASYGLMISSFGLSQHISIEIAQLKNNSMQLKKKAISAFNFQLLVTLLGGVLFIVISLLLGISDKLMIFIFLFKILLNVFRVEWYFIGKEDFKYIALRDLAVKISFLIIIFSFITDKSDIYYYALALVLGDGLANLFNIKKMVKELQINIYELLKINYEDLIEIYKGSLPFFFAGLAITIYITIDKIMLGQILGQSYVGYYSMSDRLVRIAMGITLALAVTITPRLAYYYQHDKSKYFELLNKSTKFILMLTIPMFTGISLMANDIVLLVFGKEFLPAVLTLKILSTFLIIVPFANILGLQVLNVVGEAKKYTISVIVAVVINIILNFILIVKFKHHGVAAASIVAEIVGVLVQAYFVRKLFKLDIIFDKKILNYFIASLVMGIFIFMLGTLDIYIVYKVLVQTVVGIVSYFGILLLFKEKILVELILKINRK